MSRNDWRRNGDSITNRRWDHYPTGLMIRHTGNTSDEYPWFIVQPDDRESGHEWNCPRIYSAPADNPWRGDGMRGHGRDWKDLKSAKRAVRQIHSGTHYVAADRTLQPSPRQYEIPFTRALRSENVDRMYKPLTPLELGDRDYERDFIWTAEQRTAAITAELTARREKMDERRRENRLEQLSKRYEEWTATLERIWEGAAR